MKIAQSLLKGLKQKLDQVNNISAAAVVHPRSWISGSCIGDEVSVAEGCKVFRAELAGKVSINRFTSVWGPGIHVFGPIHGVHIGSFCSIAHHVFMHESFHNIDRTTSYYIEKNLFDLDYPTGAEISRGPIVIGNDVWIGAGAILLSGVSVGDGAVIGAGAVVTRNIPPYVVAAGNPAAVIRPRFTSETTDLLQASEWWTWSEDRLRDESDFLMRLHARGCSL